MGVLNRTRNGDDHRQYSSHGTSNRQGHGISSNITLTAQYNITKDTFGMLLSPYSTKAARGCY